MRQKIWAETSESTNCKKNRFRSQVIQHIFKWPNKTTKTSHRTRAKWIQGFDKGNRRVKASYKAWQQSVPARRANLCLGQAQGQCASWMLLKQYVSWQWRLTAVCEANRLRQLRSSCFWTQRKYAGSAAKTTASRKSRRPCTFPALCPLRKGPPVLSSWLNKEQVPQLPELGRESLEHT